MSLYMNHESLILRYFPARPHLIVQSSALNSLFFHSVNVSMALSSKIDIVDF